MTEWTGLDRAVLDWGEPRLAELGSVGMALWLRLHSRNVGLGLVQRSMRCYG